MAGDGVVVGGNMMAEGNTTIVDNIITTDEHKLPGSRSVRTWYHVAPAVVETTVVATDGCTLAQ